MKKFTKSALLVAALTMSALSLGNVAQAADITTITNETELNTFMGFDGTSINEQIGKITQDITLTNNMTSGMLNQNLMTLLGDGGTKTISGNEQFTGFQVGVLASGHNITFKDLVISDMYNNNNIGEYWNYGAALINTGQIADIGTSEAKVTFNNNFVYEDKTISSGYAYGAAISNYQNDPGQPEYSASINNINADFNGNHVKAMGSDEWLELDTNATGGAIANYIWAKGTTTIGNINGTFDGNYVQAPSAYALGGAIGNFAYANSPSYASTATINSISGTFKNNYAEGLHAYGGAIANVKYHVGAKPATVTITDITGTFDKNYAKGTSTAKGGAFYSNNGVTTITDSTFTNNYAQAPDAKGGAIYTEGTLNLTATADHTITFENNYTTTDGENKTYNDIYVTNSGVVNMLGDVSMTGGIKGEGNTNVGATGASTLTLKDGAGVEGTLSLASNEAVLKASNGTKIGTLNVTDATIDLQNDALDTVTVTNFNTSTNQANFKLDYDASKTLEEGNIDNLNIKTSAAGKVKITAINVIAEGTAGTQAKWVLGTSAANLTYEDTSIKSATQDHVYTFSNSSTKGVLDVDITSIGDLKLGEVVHDTDYSFLSSYSLKADYDFDTAEYLGTLAGDDRDFTIFGNGHTINAGTSTVASTGISIAAGQTFAIENATMKGFKNTSTTADAIGGAINNAGTITNIVADFTGNYTEANATSTSGIATVYAQGGAIYNYATIGNIVNCTGGIGSETEKVTFSQNYVQANSTSMSTLGSDTSSAFADGGAIFNDTDAIITNIFADFTGNYTTANATSTSVTAIANAQGGAIYNLGTIGNITNGAGGIGSETKKVTFSKNYVQANATSTSGSAKAYALGGAIYNEGTITNIFADFTGNYTTANATADSAETGTYGGAILNTGTIGYYESEVAKGGIGTAENKALFVGNGYSDYDIDTQTGNTIATYSGGAIYNTGTITNLNADFTNNKATLMGGAISSASIAETSSLSTSDVETASTITNINGNFTNNAVDSSVADASGGAIYNYAYARAAQVTADPPKNAKATATIGNITGTFDGNYAKTTAADGSAYGGAIYNIAKKETDAPYDVTKETATAAITINNSTFENNYAQSTSGSAQGGVIYNTNSGQTHVANTGAIINFTGTNTFTGNYASASADVYGGAIYNEGTMTLAGTNVFENNYVLANVTSETGDAATVAQGGAIYNDGTISAINADFTKNYVSATATTTAETGQATTEAYGGAISNYVLGSDANSKTATIGDITGDFKGNYIVTVEKDNNVSMGGAISNFATATTSDATGTYTTTIGDIEGDFSDNYISAGDSSRAYGGAIANYATTDNANNATLVNSIGDITGDFTNNHIKATLAGGGAIINGNTKDKTKATMGTINGDFTGNYTEATEMGSLGGAIANMGVIAGIGADADKSIFSDNYAKLTGSDPGMAYGGAIYNERKITNTIYADFTNNYVSAEAGEAKGGAIFNNSSYDMTIKDADFIGNYAQGPIAQGGAIYNDGSGILTIQDTAFYGNYVVNNGVQTYNDIYNDGTINITGNTSMTGGILGTGTTNIASTGTLTLNHAFDEEGHDKGLAKLTQSAVNINGGTLNLQNGIAGDVINLKTTAPLTVSAGKTANFQIDVASISNYDYIVLADTATAGNIKLTSINLSSDLNLNDDIWWAQSGSGLSLDIANWADHDTTSTLYSATKDNFYTFTKNGDNDPGIVIVSAKTAISDLSLPQVIQGGNYSTPHSEYEQIWNYTLADDKNLNEAIGTISGTGRELSINSAEGTAAKAIDGNGFAGITVQSGQTLTIDNVNMKNFQNTSSYGGAVRNESELQNSKFTYDSNQAHKGGAVANYVTSANNIAVTDSNGTYSNNSATLHGGAVYNYSENADATISYTADNVTYSGNSALQGGAIFAQTKNGATITMALNDVTFSNNTATATTTSAMGGAITSAVSIINITGKFDGNSVVSNINKGSAGGAIYNAGEITTLEADFDSNYVTAQTSSVQGGAIYNATTATITTLTGDFTGNYAKSGDETYGGSSVQGGAICNRGTIGFTDKNTFANNYIETTGTSDSGTAQGGAIYNAKTITNLNADFTDNHAKSKGNAFGGAIYNYSDASISFTDKNTFANNYVESTEGGMAQGGAIYNGSGVTIATLNADFTDNKAESTASGKALGGAIYNAGEITTLTGGFTGNTSSGYGGAIYNKGTITNINADFTGNTATSMGGAIYNYSDNTIDTISGNFDGNSALGGGAIYNDGNIKSISANFSNNSISATSETDGVGGGAIYNGGTIDSITGNFSNNFAIVSGNNAVAGGAIVNYGTIKNITGTFSNNNVVSDLQDFALGGAIFNGDNVAMTISNSTFTGNTANGAPNDIANAGTLTFVGNNTLEGGITDVIIPGVSSTASGTTYIGNGTDETTVTLGNEATLQQKEVVLNHNAMLALGTRAANNFDVETFTVNGCALSLQNGSIDDLAFNKLVLNDPLTMMVEADLANLDMDTISASEVSGSGNILVSNIKLLSDAPASDVGMTFVKNADGLREKVQYTGEQGISYSPTYKYNVAYNSKTGMFNFTRSGGGADAYNPAVLASSVAAQAGAYLTQINTYEEAFANMDQSMLMTRAQRTAMKTRNKYAAAEGAGGGVVSYSPNQFPAEDKGIWFRPFASFENVPLNNGPRVDNISYGGLIGADSSLIELKHGWDMVWGAYAGYNGSHQNYQGNSIYQNGGMLGLNAVWYKGDFFTGLTANVGASVADATTMYGREDMAMLSTGVASKTGYNWELFNSKLIVQPSFMMSYSFINTFDYTNAAGVSIHQDPLHAIQLVPGLKFIGNLPHGWQPYIGVSMIWNIMDKTHFYANDVSLPEMSVDPYVQYGVGVQKSWGEKFTGFGQVMMRNGGRNGVSLQAGFRWALGNNGLKTNSKAGVKTNEQQRKIKLSLK